MTGKIAFLSSPKCYSLWNHLKGFFDILAIFAKNKISRRKHATNTRTTTKPSRFSLRPQITTFEKFWRFFILALFYQSTEENTKLTAQPWLMCCDVKTRQLFVVGQRNSKYFGVFFETNAGKWQPSLAPGTKMPPFGRSASFMGSLVRAKRVVFGEFSKMPMADNGSWNNAQGKL